MGARLFDPENSEMMDRPQPVNDTLVRGLENLGRLNRYFGGCRLVRWFFRGRFEPGKEYEILDLATGGGDLPRLVADLCRKAGARARIEAVDFRDATLRIAQGWSEGYPEIRYTEADVRTFSPGRSYDYVLCSLALHHFSDEDAVRILAKAASLARRGVLAADLERGGFSRFCVHLVTATLYRDEMTREDARLSVQRAFSFGEFAGLAEKAGWKGFGHRRFPPARQAVWMDGGWAE